MSSIRSDLMFFEELRITNFKRFAGTNIFPLKGEGNVTIIAAKNGVGKTTVLDAFNLVLHGAQGIKQRYGKAGFSFDDWIRKTYNTTIEGEDCQVGVQLRMSDTQLGQVLIKRDYWFEKTGGSIDMELTVRIDGKPLSIEAGESKHVMAQKWIEAFVPLAISQRFLFDGEMLPELDVAKLNLELRNGLDDILGQQAIQQLNLHLNTIMKSTTKEMTPENDQQTLEEWFTEIENSQVQEKNLIEEIANAQAELENCISKSDELQEKIVSKGKQEGESLADVRALQAIAASHLAGRRKDLIRVVSESLPFMIAGLPDDIEDWKISDAKQQIESMNVANSAREIVNQTLAKLSPKLSMNDEKRLISQLELELNENDGKIPLQFQFLGKEDLESIVRTHAMIEQDILGVAKSTIDDSVEALENYHIATKNMLAESEKLGLAEVALEYREVSAKIGQLRGEIESRKGSLAKLQTYISETNEKIANMKSLSEKDSKLNKRLDVIMKIRRIILQYGENRRKALAEPLESGFREGFKLLSRKSSNVESVTISPSDYTPTIKMKDYDGNWLDRDLSATEKQHVGLSMLYAISKLSRSQLPVVIDTPVSRMDKEHKGWSVTRFYPKLAHQVIVLTTSDDLSDGLFDELKKANCIGAQILLEETGPATAKAVTKTLEEFF